MKMQKTVIFTVFIQINEVLSTLSNDKIQKYTYKS